MTGHQDEHTDDHDRGLSHDLPRLARRGLLGLAGGVAAGVPLTVRLNVYDLNGDEATALPGAAVYVWHCDRDGNYSMYLDSDNVFSDGCSLQMARLSGSVAQGYVASLNVPV